MERNFPSSDMSNGQKKWEEILALGLDETK
jgi:hypothetical protein